MLHCFRLLYFSKTCLKEMWSFAHEQNIPASHKNVPEYLEYTQNSVRMFGMHFDYQGMYHGFSFRLHSGARVTRVLATGDVDWRTSSAALAVRETNTAGSRGSLERAIGHGSLPVIIQWPTRPHSSLLLSLKHVGHKPHVACGHDKNNKKTRNI